MCTQRTGLSAAPCLTFRFSFLSGSRGSRAETRQCPKEFNRVSFSLKTTERSAIHDSDCYFCSACNWNYGRASRNVARLCDAHMFQ